MKVQTPNDRATRARSFVEAQARLREIVSRTGAEYRQRMVWFIAIAGYVLVNGPALWNILLRHPISDLELIPLAAPWMVTALVSAFAYHEADKHQDALQLLVLERIEATNKYLFDRDFEEDVESQQWNAIVGDEAGQLSTLKKESERYQTRQNLISRAVHGLIIFSFSWAFFGPLIVR